MAGIPDAILYEVKRRTDLAQLISEHVALKRSGRGFLGLCPFHQEKTPSFHVDPERGFFHCFGCNAGGNAFTFLMRVTGATFPEAVRTLAARAGVVVPESREREGLSRLAEANELAAELFEVVLRESRQAERCRAYLEQRGISLETARRFRLGYAPASGWLERLVRRGVSEADLRTLGLAGQRTPGRDPFPLFRDRLVFPILDLSGRPIAFGGRLIGEAQGPKYLNSPETPLFRKGHHLYGLVLAREAVRASGRIVLVEGYLDVIALAQAGIENVAGVLGTALTVDQLRLARRFAEDIVVCFDGDEAGRRAALRAFPMCIEDVDLWPRAVFLPSGDDPDSLVRREGQAGFDRLLERQTTLLDFFLDDLVGRDAGPDQATRAAGKMADLLAKVRDPLVRDRLVRGVAGRLGVSEAALLAAARQRAAAAAGAGASAGGATRPGPHAMAPGARPAPPGAGVGQHAPGGRFAPAGPAARRGGAHFSVDAELVELILCDAHTAARADADGAVAEIEHPELRELAQRLLERRRSGERFDPSEFLGGLPREMAERVVRRLAAGIDGDEVRRAGEEWFRHRAARRARAERQELIARLRAAEHRRDAAQIEAALEALRLSHGESRPAEDEAGDGDSGGSSRR